jgi:hypothetical protein
MFTLIVIVVLVVLVIALSLRIDHYKRLLSDLAAYDESVLDQWQAYASTLENDIESLQDALYAFQREYGNGNKNELPLMVHKAKLPVTDRYMSRAGILVTEPKPEPKESSKSKNDNGKKNASTSKPAGVVEQTESLLGCTTNDTEKSLIAKWESGKGKADCAEYAKRLQGIRKNQK